MIPRVLMSAQAYTDIKVWHVTCQQCTKQIVQPIRANSSDQLSSNVFTNQCVIIIIIIII